MKLNNTIFFLGLLFNLITRSFGSVVVNDQYALNFLFSIVDAKGSSEEAFNVFSSLVMNSNRNLIDPERKDLHYVRFLKHKIKGKSHLKKMDFFANKSKSRAISINYDAKSGLLRFSRKQMCEFDNFPNEQCLFDEKFEQTFYLNLIFESGEKQDWVLVVKNKLKRPHGLGFRFSQKIEGEFKGAFKHSSLLNSDLDSGYLLTGLQEKNKFGPDVSKIQFYQTEEEIGDINKELSFPDFYIEESRFFTIKVKHHDLCLLEKNSEASRCLDLENSRHLNTAYYFQSIFLKVFYRGQVSTNIYRLDFTPMD
jgi:hypothetical protein